MNKQIEKFIDDAKLTAVCEVFESELEKFAQLIVQECADVAAAEIAELKEELADKRKFCYEVELALDGLKGDYIEIINKLRQKNEYICKCGLRIEPHRCKTGEGF